MSVSIWEGNKAGRVADAVEAVEVKLDNITLMLAAIADTSSDGSEGSGLYFKNFKTLQQLNRMGLASKVLDSYSYIVVNKETGMTIAVHGANLTGATVDEAAFVSQVGEAATKEYEFIFDGTSWHLDGATVLLPSYGITLAGTAADGDTITVDETASAIRYDVLGIDHDIPADPHFSHTITLCRHDCTAYSSLAYKIPQGLIYVDPAQFPNGLEANQLYYIVGDCICYDGTTKEDGLYGFIPTVAVPAGGLVRHSAMGGYMSSSSGYNKARVLAGTWSTYDTIANGRAAIETNIATVEADGESGTLLGTATAESVVKRVTPYINLTRRNAYGSNYYLGSDERAWMNSGAAKGVDAKGVQLWQSGKLGIFDRPATYNAAGNLRGMDPQLLDVIGPVRKRTYLSPVDRENQDIKYVDTEETVFPLSMLEANLGTTNDGVYENAVDAAGNVKTVPYPYYQRRTDAKDRIKYQNGVARDWWLRSPHPSHCGTVRNCTAAGALNSHGASNTYGAVDAYNII